MTYRVEVVHDHRTGDRQADALVEVVHIEAFPGEALTAARAAFPDALGISVSAVIDRR